MQTYEEKNKPLVNNTGWQCVKNARKQNRPNSRDYIPKLFTDFFEVKGDRCLGDDYAIVTGIARFMDTPVTVIAQQKGHTIQERKRCNFGMPYPAGYRKSMRAIKQAEKFKRPIICLIDTPGAYCGVKAEEQGQGTVIAEHLRLIAGVKVPVISVLIGEGGSGGALALAICDKLIALQNTYFSVISPESCSTILFKDSAKAEIAANSLKLTPDDLLRMKIADFIASEKDDFTIDNMKYTVDIIKEKISEYLAELKTLNDEELIAERYKKIMKGIN